MIAFGGIYIFLRSVVVGLQFGIRVTDVPHAIEVVVLLMPSFAMIGQGGAAGLSMKPFAWSAGAGGNNIFLAFGLAVLEFGGFEASAPLVEETNNPRRDVPIAFVGPGIVIGCVSTIFTDPGSASGFLDT